MINFRVFSETSDRSAVCERHLSPIPQIFFSTPPRGYTNSRQDVHHTAESVNRFRKQLAGRGRTPLPPPSVLLSRAKYDLPRFAPAEYSRHEILHRVGNSARTHTMRACAVAAALFAHACYDFFPPYVSSTHSERYKSLVLCGAQRPYSWRTYNSGAVPRWCFAFLPCKPRARFPFQTRGYLHTRLDISTPPFLRARCLSIYRSLQTFTLICHTRDDRFETVLRVLLFSLCKLFLCGDCLRDSTGADRCTVLITCEIGRAV